MAAPRYFCVVLGRPDPREEKTWLEDGRYKPYGNFPYPTFPRRGDWLVFYCTGSYPEYQLAFPGVGKVLEWDGEWIRYEYRPFRQPVSRRDILEVLDPDFRRRMRQLRFPVNWLFPITLASFARLVNRGEIPWPK